MSEIYRIYNGPMPTTAAQLKVTTGTVIKTMLQVKLGTQVRGRINAWGISLDGSAAATPGTVELCETGTIFGTVTASAAADIHKVGDPNGVDPTTSAFIISTTATGYTCTSEGSIVAVRMFDAVLLPPTGPYAYQWPRDESRPKINVSTALRIRVTYGAAISAICWVEIEI